MGFWRCSRDPPPHHMPQLMSNCLCSLRSRLNILKTSFRDWNFQASRLINFKPATHQGPIFFAGNSVAPLGARWGTTIRTKTITNENQEILVCFRFCNGEAIKFPQIFSRICFRYAHVGHAQATTAGHNSKKNQSLPDYDKGHDKGHCEEHHKGQLRGTNHKGSGDIPARFGKVRGEIPRMCRRKELVFPMSEQAPTPPPDGLKTQELIFSARIKRASTKGVSTMRGIFWISLLETTVSNSLNLGKADLFMDTPFVDTPLLDPETLQRVRANFLGRFYCEFGIRKCLFGSC